MVGREAHTDYGRLGCVAPPLRRFDLASRWEGLRPPARAEPRRVDPCWWRDLAERWEVQGDGSRLRWRRGLGLAGPGHDRFGGRLRIDRAEGPERL
jgi:hypothetical protein